MKYLRCIASVIVFMLLTSCGMPVFFAVTPTLAPTNTPEPSPTSSPTNTLEPTATPSPTSTIVPTLEPMIAIAKTPITLRSMPSQGGDMVGGVRGNEKVQVIARNSAATWFYIIAPNTPAGKAWALAAGFTLQGDLSNLPIAIFPEGSNLPVVLPYIPLTMTPALPIAITLAQINVRSGPASSFSSYGLIEEKQPVTILGQTLNKLWFQIQYPAAPNGVAWLPSIYVQVMKSIQGLPYFDNDGSPLPKP